MSNYYNETAKGYDELHKEEQLLKLKIIYYSGIVDDNDVMLDVGCGTGFSLDYFGVKSATGIDPAEKLVEQYSGDQKILVGSAEDLPFVDNSFDIVISVTAIQNFTDVKKGFEEIKRVGKKRFALCFLKRLEKTEQLETSLREVFEGSKIQRLEEAKDYIFLIR